MENLLKSNQSFLNESKGLIISIEEFQGVQRFDVRKWFAPKSVLVPTKMGISLTVGEAQTLLTELSKFVANNKP